ncbi:fasciclin domain-containing protein [Brasilonema sp. UFV-L1]|uniref:fasciclin domain-containing protein n=1 Tax=Brasilonema sp. UFV-L1 TaxID=2234130 RepID=UPI00145ED2F7|nr:fasciclin domain-containing protein [Brasilonema sp. UFV-L1]NMG11036.1 fasciclin domain-containing protein [Brasilonema sp. UFV-L1]
MKVEYSNFVTKLAGMVGVTGITLVMSLPSGASEVLNRNSNLVTEASYNGGQRTLVNTQSAPNRLASEATKSEKTPAKNTKVAQGRGVNPSPSILQECPYNRAACPGGATPSTPSTPTPEAVPTPPGTEVPTTPGTPTTPPGPGTETPPKEPAAGTESKNLVAIAESNGSFKMLTKALKAAGLVQTLEGKGPFTVFAPTDAAFAKLPQDAVQDLLKPENKEVLVKILRYHVVQGSVTSKDLKSGEVKSIEGGPINVKVDPSAGVQVNDAKVVQPDIKASNGVIHVIDNVILPPDL